MAASVAKPDTIVTKAIQEINHIATLPEVTLKIVELVEKPTSTAQDLNRQISNDPALSSRILKVVNSAFYGLPGQIASIDRAIVLLGLNAVKNIAVAASLVKLFRGGDLHASFSARDLWTHSIATATAAKKIADAMQVGMTDEAFLGGLMHDIGVIVELQWERQKLVETLDRLGIDDQGVPSADMLAIETEVFGANHQQFGEALCQRWKFPPSLSLIAGHHHNPLALPEERRTLPAIVYIADRLAARVGSGFRLDLLNTDIGPAVLEALHLSPETLAQVEAELPEALQEVKRVLN